MTGPGGHRLAAVALLTLVLACGDAPTAPNAEQETLLLSLVGLGGDDAGIVLEISGAADHIESASAGFEVAWVTDGTNVATVAIVGPLSDGAQVLRVRRRAGLAPLRAEVREIARSDGTLSSTASARAILDVVP
jgi:hypothetical protein